MSALRHSHTVQDELVYILDGEPDAHHRCRRDSSLPGMCAGFAAGSGDAHHLVNRTDRDFGTSRSVIVTPGDTPTYPDDDLAAVVVGSGWRFTRKDGSDVP